MFEESGRVNSECGQGMVEYALILGVVIILAAVLTNNNISNSILEIGGAVIDTIRQVSNI